MRESSGILRRAKRLKQWDNPSQPVGRVGKERTRTKKPSSASRSLQHTDAGQEHNEFSAWRQLVS